MNKLYDLSHTFEEDMTTYPDDEASGLKQAKCYDQDGYTTYILKSGMHAGTHMDAPMHLTGDKRFISEYPVECFCGNGCLIDVRGQKIIGYKGRYEALIQTGDVVLLFTGHDKKFKTGSYYTDHPLLSPEFADFLVKKEIKMLGVDLPSPDFYPFPIHKKLLSQDIFILENLTGLEQLLSTNRFEVFAFPLKLNAEASLVRVIAREY